MNKKQLLSSLSVLMGAGLLNSLNAVTIISSDHVDIGVAYEDGEWDLHLHVGDEPDDFELEPDEGILYGSESNSGDFKATIPSDPEFSFLGTPGDSVWIFPQVEDEGLPFLGIAAEEVDANDFVGDLTLSFTGLYGQGDFFLYQTDSFGSPTILFDSTDGFAGDSITLEVGAHGHYNFAFTEEGVFGVELQASGVLNDGNGTVTTSDPIVYTFGVNAIPEPETYALWSGILTVAFLVVRRRMKKA